MPSRALSRDARGHGVGSAAKNFAVYGPEDLHHTGTVARVRLDFARRIIAPADIIHIVRLDIPQAVFKHLNKYLFKHLNREPIQKQACQDNIARVAPVNAE